MPNHEGGKRDAVDGATGSEGERGGGEDDGAGDVPLRANDDETSSPCRAVQRCRLAVTESALQHLMVEVRHLIARGISEPAIV